MKKIYNKLVRDGTPEIILAEGRHCATEIMNETEYLQALLTKLVEEAQEVADASPDKRSTELADLLEVIKAFMKAQNLDEKELQAIQAQRYEERGGFEKRIKLLWAE